jgi:hypothetical protein
LLLFVWCKRWLKRGSQFQTIQQISNTFITKYPYNNLSLSLCFNEIEKGVKFHISNTDEISKSVNLICSSTVRICSKVGRSRNWSAQHRFIISAKILGQVSGMSSFFPWWATNEITWRGVYCKKGAWLMKR